MQSDVTEAMRVQTLHVVSVVQFCKPFQGHNFWVEDDVFDDDDDDVDAVGDDDDADVSEDDDGLDDDAHDVDVDNDDDDVDVRMAASWARECGMSVPG